MKWIDAIKRVMQEENKSLHYIEITKKIINKGYRDGNQLGQTPERTVSKELTTHPNTFIKISDGVYILNKLKLSTHWLISSNSNRFRLSDCLQDNGFVDWNQSRSHFNVGDIVFVYCSAPESSVRYMMDVIEVDIPTNEAFNEEIYWKDKEEYNEGLKESRYCRLKLICESVSPKLKLSELLDNGLNKVPQSPQKISPQLQNYIIDIFENSSLDTELIDENNKAIYEGIKKQVCVNRYERSPIARKQCLESKGYSCSVCGFNFEDHYGEIGKEFIHIHHITPISQIGEGYEINPETDLVPVCPNCHAMLHQRNSPLSIEELKSILKDNLQ